MGVHEAVSCRAGWLFHHCGRIAGEGNAWLAAIPTATGFPGGPEHDRWPRSVPSALLDQTGPSLASNRDGPEEQPLKTEFAVEDQ